jgi:hypothetical protein
MTARGSGGTKITTTIDTSGPFFAHDPTKTFRQNARELMDAVADAGQIDVRAQLRAGRASRKPISELDDDHVEDYVIGRTRNLAGRRWAVSAVVSVNNNGFSPKQGIALMAAAAVVERQTHAFRRTTGRIRRARGVNLDELMKGVG